MRNCQIFKKYEDNIRESLAPVCRYQYVTAQRVIVRKGHQPEALYYIVSGQVDLTKIEIDNVTGQYFSSSGQKKIVIFFIFKNFLVTLHFNHQSVKRVTTISSDLIIGIM